MGRKEIDANGNAVAAAPDKLCRRRVVGSRVFVAGGQAGPNPAAGPSYSYFWMLDLDQETPIWRVLPTWPGPERFYAVAGSDGKSFYLFSGIRCVDDDQGSRSWNTCETHTDSILRPRNGNDWPTCRIPMQR